MDYPNEIIRIVKTVKSERVLKWIYEFASEWAKTEKEGKNK